MPKALRVGFTGSYRRNILVHGHGDTNELNIQSEFGLELVEKTLTMLVAKYQEMIVNGKATIYLTLLVKFSSKAKLPKKPQARDIAFKMTSLSQHFSISVLEILQKRTHQCGSGMSTPRASNPSGNCPLFGSVTLHFETKAAIDSTFAIGPIVAARRGMAVEANHQSLYWS
jgi:hypothetical protein